MRTGRSRHKPIWLNYAQWLLGPTRRWHSWDRNETSFICLLRVTELSEFFCFDTNQWVTPTVGICVTDSCPSCGNPILLELFAFECGCFQSGDIPYMFERRLPFAPPHPTGCLLCFGVPWLFSPKLDGPVAPCQPDTGWPGQAWRFWHVLRSLFIWIASEQGFIHKMCH